MSSASSTVASSDEAEVGPRGEVEDDPEVEVVVQPWRKKGCKS